MRNTYEVLENARLHHYRSLPSSLSGDGLPVLHWEGPSGRFVFYFFPDGSLAEVVWEEY